MQQKEEHCTNVITAEKRAIRPTDPMTLTGADTLSARTAEVKTSSDHGMYAGFAENRFSTEKAPMKRENCCSAATA